MNQKENTILYTILNTNHFYFFCERMGPVSLHCSQHVYSINYTSSCHVFANTLHLIPYCGNAIHPFKFDPLLNSFLNVENGILNHGILTLDCDRHKAKLVEGNHRHAVYCQLNRPWFPIKVIVQGQYESWKLKRHWEMNLKDILWTEFGIETLDLHKC